MITKVILFPAPDGEYFIPLMEVAKNRAEYYAEEDGFAIGSKEWQDEIDYVMQDSFEGIDWLINNTDFDDWDCAIKINNEHHVTDEDFWCSSDGFEIIEMAL